ncbi:WW domain-containing adapter protein with coiled-coil homolog isoform X2 [Achroia grisella]|uniref:WW domain-containing adapter protein with coiled-coil homolog isoform X2 n=1 Tax=Achroia grisella TaxID=688607 RepID=UPI0027D2F60E|nr:WW domain-containing adapter protein with coiled-coil homolog isoform X2 [Achroia grisella]
MEKQCALIFLTIFHLQSSINAAETVLSAVLTPDEKLLSRQSRSYYDPRYGVGRPYDLGRLYDPRPYDRYYDSGRLDYDRPRCGRCDDRYDDRDDDNDRRRDRYDDDRRVNHRPTYGNRYDRNKSDNDDDRRYDTDRNNGNKNGTDDDNDSDKKRPYDDKDNRPSGSKRGDRDRNRNRYDDRDRYRPDYYDRFLRDPSRDRDRNERPYYDDIYRERRPIYERDYDGYASRYDGYANRYDGAAYPSYRRPIYEGYDRGYDDGYGGYGPSAGRGPHDRPWDETYRGQAGWDAGGRGYYFASGRPDSAPATAWDRPGYARPQESGWQNVGYNGGGYRDPLEYRGSLGYGLDGGYRQDVSTGYGQVSGWQNVGERRPYRDQSGVAHLDDRNTYPSRDTQSSGYGQRDTQSSGYGQRDTQNTGYGQTNRQPSNYGQQNTYQSSNIATGYGQSSSTTPSTSYLFQREDERVTTKSADETTKAPS